MGNAFEDYNFIEKETLVQVFSCEFWKSFKNTYFEEHPASGCRIETHVEIKLQRLTTFKLSCVHYFFNWFFFPHLLKIFHKYLFWFCGN